MTKKERELDKKIAELAKQYSTSKYGEDDIDFEHIAYHSFYVGAIAGIKLTKSKNSNKKECK